MARRKPGAGRKCETDEARAMFFTVRLSPAEREAIRAIQANLTKQIRELARDRLRGIDTAELPKAS